MKNAQKISCFLRPRKPFCQNRVSNPLKTKRTPIWREITRKQNLGRFRWKQNPIRTNYRVKNACAGIKKTERRQKEEGERRKEGGLVRTILYIYSYITGMVPWYINKIICRLIRTVINQAHLLMKTPSKVTLSIHNHHNHIIIRQKFQTKD